MPQSDVIVVGAGVAGLWCAALLAGGGLRVAVLDAADAPGGRARSWRDETSGLEVDIGPHVVTSEHRNFLAMLEHLGTRDRIAWQPDPLITLLDAGRKLRMPNRAWLPPLHGLPLLPQALRSLGWSDLLSHWRLAWCAARTNEQRLRALDSEDALAWLRRMGVSDRAIEWFWRSALLALLNTRLEQCSAAAAMRVLRLMMGRSGYCFGFPSCGLSRLYVPGCTQAVERAGGEVRLRTGAKLVQRRGDGWCVTVADGREVQAPRMVLALPPADFVALVQASGLEPLQALAAQASVFQPSPYVSTVLWFDRPLTRERFWARVWSAADMNTDFYDLSNIRPELAGGASVIASNAIGPLARPELDDRAIVERTWRELCDFAPSASDSRPVHARVHRIPMAIPVPAPGTETRRPRNETGVKALWLAGDWTDTGVPCSMESAARSGALAAQAVLRDLGSLAQVLPIDPPETRGLVALLRRPAPSPAPGSPLPRTTTRTQSR